MANAVYGDFQWITIRSGQICPVCGSRAGRCSIFAASSGEVIFYKCKYAQSNEQTKDGWYKHYVKDLNSSHSNIKTKIKLEEYKPTTITAENLLLWDKVYRAFRNAFFKINGSYLYPNHYDNLIQRGFSDVEIRNMGFFSVPKNNNVFYDGYNCKLSTAIINELKKTFKEEELLKVPGFSKRTYNDNDYVVFKNTIKNQSTNSFEDLDAYFIPYYNENKLLVGMQYRLTTPILDRKGKKIRYLWYSFSNSDITCGSPIDYYVPMNISIDDVLLVSEGAIKCKYAATKFGIRSVAEAGVGNYRNLVKTIQSIESIENKRYKILLALDMDKYDNPDVIKAEISTVALLKSLGYSVTILEWDKSDGKGVDDKLLATSQSGFRYLNI